MINNVFNNIEWNELNECLTGLPRPHSNVLKQHRKNYKLAFKVPIPWQSRANNNSNSFLTLINKNEDIIYYKNLCSYCGVKINDNENVIRWKNNKLNEIRHNGKFVLSDIHPLHLECMRQTRIYCPGMRKK